MFFALPDLRDLTLGKPKGLRAMGRPATTVVNIQLGLIDSNALYSLFQLGNLE
jgi:hypothetical protein